MMRAVAVQGLKSAAVPAESVTRDYLPGFAQATFASWTHVKEAALQMTDFLDANDAASVGHSTGGNRAEAFEVPQYEVFR
jgi:hypothetical protein